LFTAAQRLRSQSSWFTEVGRLRKPAAESDMEMSLKNFNFKSVARSGLRLVIISAAGIQIAACNAGATLNPKSNFTHGYVLDENALQFVPVGSSREQVLLALGTPSTKATFDTNEAYYYITQKTVRPAAFMLQRVVERKVLAIYFGTDDRVTKIANYGLKDGHVFDFISRTTPTGGKDESFVGQILRSTTGGGTGAPPTNIFGG
jgi:outer membrane protein assembly factor BamE (lipoprotein component of BamABCDE complex)